MSKSMNKDHFLGFVPHRLEIDGVPELNHFSFNVLFASFGIRDGEKVMGDAIYNPDFSSFKKDGEKYSMQYRNSYGGESWLRVDYDIKKESWVGEKFVNGESVGMAFGSEWQMFFVHFTMLGLKNGERCMFEKVENVKK